MKKRINIETESAFKNQQKYTHADQHEARLEPGAAAAEERQHDAQRADGDEQRIGTKRRMVGQQCRVAAIREPQPNAGAQEGAAA